MKQFVLLALLFVLNHNSMSQKDQTLFFGVNVGTKLANKNYAARYNGAYPFSTLESSELYVMINTLYNYDKIYQQLGDKHFALTEESYTTNMKYAPGIVTGVTIGYQVSPNFQMSLDANFAKLKSRNVFTIEVYDPGNFTSEPVIELGDLYAEESRFDGRFNLDYVTDESNKLKYIFGVSGLFTAWRIDEHFAMFQGYKMPLFTVHNPANNFFNITKGIGWGGGLNLGLEYRVNDKIVAQLLYQPYHTKVNYGFTIPKRVLLQHDITVRLLWK